MKLISPFHDYYDTVLAHGRDDSVRFVRRTEVVHVGQMDAPWNVTSGRLGVAGSKIVSFADTALPNFNRWNKASDNFIEAFAIIAGRAHAVWVRDAAHHLWGADGGYSPDVVWGHPDVEKLEEKCLRNYVSKLSPHASKTHKYTCTHFGVKTGWRDSKNELPRLYEQARQTFLEKDWTGLNMEHETPVLVVLPRADYEIQIGSSRDLLHPITIVKNPCLSALNMQAVLDPFQVFQDISQFIGGVMPGRSSPMVQVTDKDQVLKKGFDPTYGFRTRPSGP